MDWKNRKPYELKNDLLDFINSEAKDIMGNSGEWANDSDDKLLGAVKFARHLMNFIKED